MKINIYIIIIKNKKIFKIQVVNGEIMPSRILVVDDGTVNVMLLSRVLKNAGFETDSANSGLEALKKIKNSDFHLVLLDVMMPSIDGFETCRRIHKINSDIPVIMVTALSNEEYIQKSFDAGAIDYIRKPINKTEVLARVHNIIKIKESEERINNLYSSLIDDLDIATGVQSYLIPEWLMEYEKIHFSSIYEPSEKVSGDIFDVIQINENKSIVYIGDISGHGVQSALLMTAVLSVLKIIVDSEGETPNPCSIITKLSKILKKEFFYNNYLTMLLGVLDFEEQTFEYFNAGHPPLIHYNRKTKKAEMIKDKGSIPIGWMNNFEYSEDDTNFLKLSSDSIFLLYTDGLYECEDKNNRMIGMDGLIDLINKIDNLGKLAFFPYIIKEKLISLNYDLSADDLSLLAFKIRNKNRNIKKFFFTVSPKLQEVSTIGKDCEEIILNQLKNESKAAEVELIVNECLNNIILHGKQKEKTIHFELSIAEKIRLIFIDNGPEWIKGTVDSKKLNRPELAEDFATSGRGLQIIKDLSEEFTISRYSEMNETTIKLDI